MEMKSSFCSIVINLPLLVLLSGPTLYTLCTTVIDLDERTLTIIEGNPKYGKVSHVFSMSSNELNLKLVNHAELNLKLVNHAEGTHL